MLNILFALSIYSFALLGQNCVQNFNSHKSSLNSKTKISSVGVLHQDLKIVKVAKRIGAQKSSIVSSFVQEAFSVSQIRLETVYKKSLALFPVYTLPLVLYECFLI